MLTTAQELQIIKTQIAEMERINPKKEPSHPVEDWALENFVDRVRGKIPNDALQSAVDYWDRYNH